MSKKENWKKEKLIEEYFDIPITCDYCRKCWWSDKHQSCLYGGPFKREKPLTSEK